MDIYGCCSTSLLDVSSGELKSPPWRWLASSEVHRSASSSSSYPGPGVPPKSASYFKTIHRLAKLYFLPLLSLKAFSFLNYFSFLLSVVFLRDFTSPPQSPVLLFLRPSESLLRKKTPTNSSVTKPFIFGWISFQASCRHPSLTVWFTERSLERRHCKLNNKRSNMLNRTRAAHYSYYLNS